MSLFFMVTFMNAVAMFLHFLDFVSGMNGGKGIILDFIGQCKSLHAIHSLAGWC